MYKVGKNQTFTEWPQTVLKQLTVKGTLYRLKYLPLRPKFGPFRSTISPFRETLCTRSVKIGNVQKDALNS